MQMGECTLNFSLLLQGRAYGAAEGREGRKAGLGHAGWRATPLQAQICAAWRWWEIQQRFQGAAEVEQDSYRGHCWKTYGRFIDN